MVKQPWDPGSCKSLFAVGPDTVTVRSAIHDDTFGSLTAVVIRNHTVSRINQQACFYSRGRARSAVRGPASVYQPATMEHGTSNKTPIYTNLDYLVLRYRRPTLLLCSSTSHVFQSRPAAATLRSNSARTHRTSHGSHAHRDLYYVPWPMHAHALHIMPRGPTR